MSAAERMLRQRTEVEVAADVVACILESGIVKRDAVTVAAMARAAHVPVGDVKEAWRRVQDGKYEPPVQRPIDAEAHEPPPHLRSANRTRWLRKNPAPGMRRCSRCQATKPNEDFGIKNPRTGQRKSMCRPCEHDYQRTRYLSVSKVNMMNAVGLTFVVTEGDDVHGLACVDCGAPILVGQTVCGRAELRHAECPRDPVPMPTIHKMRES